MGSIQTKKWLTETRRVLTRLERQTTEIAIAIASEDNPRHAETLRAEWSQLVGSITVLALSMSDKATLVSHRIERSDDRNLATISSDSSFSLH